MSAQSIGLGNVGGMNEQTQRRGPNRCLQSTERCIRLSCIDPLDENPD